MNQSVNRYVSSIVDESYKISILYDPIGQQLEGKQNTITHNRDGVVVIVFSPQLGFYILN